MAQFALYQPTDYRFHLITEEVHFQTVVRIEVFLGLLLAFDFLFRFELGKIF